MHIQRPQRVARRSHHAIGIANVQNSDPDDQPNDRQRDKNDGANGGSNAWAC